MPYDLHVIVISGSLAFDKIAEFAGRFEDHILAEKLDALSVVFTLQKSRKEFGGTAGNIAFNLSLLGEKPYIVSNTGGDFEDYFRHLKEIKLPLDFIRAYRDEQTAECMIINDKKRNQIATFYGGALSNPLNLRRIEHLAGKIRLGIVSPTDFQSMLNAAGFFQRHSIPFILDPGQQIGNFDENNFYQSLKKAHLLIMNDYEWGLARKNLHVDKERVLETCENLIVTLGGKGMVIHSRQGEERVAAVKPLKIVEATGCGDALRAGIIYGMKKGWDLPRGCRLGACLATKTIENYGTQNHRISKRELDKLIN